MCASIRIYTRDRNRDRGRGARCCQLCPSSSSSSSSLKQMSNWVYLKPLQYGCWCWERRAVALHYRCLTYSVLDSELRFPSMCFRSDLKAHYRKVKTFLTPAGGCHCPLIFKHSKPAGRTEKCTVMKLKRDPVMSSIQRAFFWACCLKWNHSSFLSNGPLSACAMTNTITLKITNHSWCNSNGSGRDF